ncbi:chondroitin sulfate proteoglycan 5 isoform X3 [Pipistrellus kuhlii]|uniref:chondroitin sulfate proteoglycan 5 isoform X3 n=1 Tax=Pipistrellus kuhlii TaxID=59472 RepID=UPI001E26FA5A|nr:chondroitin sulfate proteoglycan 5 isoform X3 [Pipistrellus kuhlii]
MGRAGAGGPGRGPPLLLLAAALVLAGAAPAREAGSAVAVDVDEPAPTTPAWEPRANATRAPAGPPGAGAAEAWTAEAAGGPGAGPEDALEASAVTGTAWEADGPGLGAGPAEAGSGDTQAPPATPRAPAPAPAPRRTRAAETPSWSLLDLYDDFTPFDESDFYPTTSFYDDLDEDGDGDGEGGPAPGPGTGPPPGWWHAVPPRPPGPAPGGGIALRPRPGEPARDPAAGENGTACRSGFVRHNSSCRSVCDLLPSYCHNGGQCYQVEGIGALCSKFRTPSELHNDNFSLSTIAEGSHPNDDPSAPHKIQEVLKSCLKEEEPFLAQNSLSPKLEGGRRDPAQLEPNCLQNNLT